MVDVYTKDLKSRDVESVLYQHLPIMKSIPKFSVFVLPGIIFLFSCQKELLCPDCIVNQRPVAKAGTDQFILLPKDNTIIDGSSSADPDGNITSYKWIKISGPDSSGISNPDSATTLINALVMGFYKFELTVTDNNGLLAKDTIQITVDNTLPLCADLVPFGTLSIARYGVSAITAGSKILFAGGATANTPPPYSLWVNSTRVDIYDTLTKKWSTAELSEPRYLPVIVTVGNKTFFAGGGIDTLNYGMDIYDAASNSWSKVTLPYPGIIVRGSSGAAVGDKIYFAGGSSDESYFARHTDSVYIYDILTNSWSPSTTLLSEKRNPVYASSVGNKIYFAGGEGIDSVNGIYVTDKVDIYDAAANAWSTTTMYEPKVAMTSIVAGNKIFWAGGLNASIPPTGLTLTLWKCTMLIQVSALTINCPHHLTDLPQL